MIDFLRNNLLWVEGLPIVAVLAVITIVLFFIYKPLVILPLGFFIFSIYFFRNPVRVCKEALEDTSVLVCPSDGKVIEIIHDESNGIEGYAQRVSIFLSAFDVHVNWAPISGTVQEVKYKKGAFKLAYLPKSSELNERNDLLIKDQHGKTIRVRQIAGLVARRIVCWVKAGDAIQSGQKYGMIKFGSRVDILLPSDVKLNVEVGQRVYGGQTVLGRWM